MHGGNMMKVRLLKFVIFIGLMVIMFFNVSPAKAQDLDCEKVVIGDRFTLEDGETLPANLCALGGIIYLRPESRIEGDVFLAGGQVTVEGVITGNLNTLGTEVLFGETGIVDGDVNLIGANPTGIEKAVVLGEINQNDWPAIPAFPTMNKWEPVISYDRIFGGLLWLPLRSFLWAALAILVLLFAPKLAVKIQNSAMKEPVLSGGVGLATSIVVITVMILLAITIVCIPFSFFLGLAFLLAWALGLVSLGLEVGQRLAELAKQEWAPAVSAGLGIFLLTLVLNGIDYAIPCIGFLPKFLVSIVGIGAVILSRFGTYSYPLDQDQVTSLLPPVE
jgi:hypothetical protein